MIDYTTEYLILHENEINWDSLSNNEDRSFSLAEIRIFRKRINWSKYLLKHQMTLEQLEIASKYFTKKEYDIIAMFSLVDESFIENHKYDFNWELVISNCNISADVLSACFDCWKNIDKNRLESAFKKNTKIDIHNGTYDAMLLYLKLDI